MSDVKYSVEVEFMTKGNLGKNLGLGGAAGSLGSAVGSVGEAAAQKWQRSFNNTFGTLTSGVQSLANAMSMDKVFDGVAAAGKGAFAAIKFGIVDMNAQIEEMTIGLGTIFTANGVSDNLSAGMEKASGMMKQMRKDAAVLPGTFNDLASIFQTILAPALNSGMDPDRIRKMATNAMAYGTAIGLRAPVIGRELAAMLSGQARGQNILAQRLPGMQLHGAEAKKFNALSNDDRVKKLEQSLGLRGGKEGVAIGEANKAYEKSWVGTLSTLKDKFKLFAGEATLPLFDRLKVGFTWLTGWLDANEDRTKKWAGSIGRGLEGGLEIARMSAERLLPILAKAGDFIMKEKDKGHLRRDVSIAGWGITGMAVASKLAGPAMSVAGSGASMLAKVGASQPEVALAAVVALVAAMVPLAVIAFSTAGAVQALTDDLSYYHATAVSSVMAMKGLFGEAMKQYAEIWKQIEDPLMNISGLLGVTLLESLVLASKAIVGFLEVVSFFATSVYDWMKVFAPMLTGHLENKGAHRKNDREFEYDNYDASKMKTPPVVQNHTTNIGHIEIKVISNQDPNRIAKKVFDIQMEAARNPTTVNTPMKQFYRPGSL